jgi:hypothetical protein
MYVYVYVHSQKLHNFIESYSIWDTRIAILIQSDIHAKTLGKNDEYLKKCQNQKSCLE